MTEHKQSLEDAIEVHDIGPTQTREAKPDGKKATEAGIDDDNNLSNANHDKGSGIGMSELELTPRKNPRRAPMKSQEEVSTATTETEEVVTERKQSLEDAIEVHDDLFVASINEIVDTDAPEIKHKKKEMSKQKLGHEHSTQVRSKVAKDKSETPAPATTGIKTVEVSVDGDNCWANGSDDKILDGLERMGSANDNEVIVSTDRH